MFNRARFQPTVLAMPRRILLLHNTPKARRYFRQLAEHIPDLDIRAAAIGLSSGPRLADTRYASMARYSMERKWQRHRIPNWRMQSLQRVHQRFAHWHYHAAAAAIKRHQPDAIGVWGGQSVDTRAALEAARDHGVPSYVFECGLLPNTTTCDPEGVNFENAIPRYPRFYANYSARATHPLPDTLIARASHHRDDAIELPQDYFFIPFQVRLDSQVLLYSPWIRDMTHLFDVIVEAARNALGASNTALVFKLHPSCRQHYRALQDAAARDPRIHFANGNSTDELVRQARGVITINSTVGIEALLLNRPVLTLGQACYAIPGVCDSASSVAVVSRWMQQIEAGRTPDAPHRDAFLRYLANEYCIPQSHKHPGEAHFAAISTRLASHPRQARVNHARPASGLALSSSVLADAPPVAQFPAAHRPAAVWSAADR